MCTGHGEDTTNLIFGAFCVTQVSRTEWQPRFCLRESRLPLHLQATAC